MTYFWLKTYLLILQKVTKKIRVYTYITLSTKICSKVVNKYWFSFYSQTQYIAFCKAASLMINAAKIILAHARTKLAVKIKLTLY